MTESRSALKRAEWHQATVALSAYNSEIQTVQNEYDDLSRQPQNVDTVDRLIELEEQLEKMRRKRIPLKENRDFLLSELRTIEYHEQRMAREKRKAAGGYHPI